MKKGKEKKTIRDHNGMVVKSNMLVEASYKLGVNEHKMIRFVASKIKKDDEDFKTYTLSVKEFAEAIGIKNQSIYQDIEKISMDILRKPLKIKMNGKAIMIPWFSYISYNSGEGTVDVRFDKFFKPHLLNLKSHFIGYTFQNIAKLRSNYAIRLYELLKQYQKIGHRIIGLDELREILCVEDVYPEYANLKQKVLKVAQKEIETKTDITFTFEEIKQGRKVEKIKFNIITGSQVVENQTQTELLDAGEMPNLFVERIKASAQKQGLDIGETDILGWEHYGERMVLNVFQQIKRRDDIRDVRAYVSKVLNELQKQSEEAERKGSEDRDLPSYVVNQLNSAHEEVAASVDVNPNKQNEILELLHKLGEIDDKEYEERKKQILVV